MEPLQLESKKKDEGDRHMLSAENACFIQLHLAPSTKHWLIPLKLEVAVHGTQQTGTESNVTQGRLE